MAWRLTTQRGSLRMRVQSLASLSGSKIRRCRGLWPRSQNEARILCYCGCGTASSCSSNSTPSPGTSICQECGPKNQKKKVTKEKTGCQQSYQGADQCQGMISSHAKALRRQPTKLEKRFVNRMSGEGGGPEGIRNS